MKNGKHPNPNTIHPIAGYDKEIYVKPTIHNPNILVGEFTYIADSEFESQSARRFTDTPMWNSTLPGGSPIRPCGIPPCQTGSVP